MRALDWLLGRPLSTLEEEKQRIGLLAGIPVLGLDALSSAAYGPEAALTLLLPLGALGLRYVGPITALIVLILLIVYFSYRQTIAAYPGGGGSYTVAKENLGQRAALVAGAALAIDYVLNVAVGISAGVGALVSAVPFLLPHTLALCLAILVLLTLVNLRGVRESGVAFMLPTYGFVATLFLVIAIGLIKTVFSHGHPSPVVAPPSLPQASRAVGLWILLRAFASGCTAMTGVEAVSNGVPLFRKPTVPTAQRTLTAIIAILVVLLAGIALLARAYGIVATEPGQAGYHSVLSMLVGAVTGTRHLLLPDDCSNRHRVGFVGEHQLCRLPATLPRARRGPLPPGLLRGARTPPGVLTGDHHTVGAGGRAAHRVRRHHRSVDSPVRDRRLPRVHALAGGDGRALAARRRPVRAPLDADQCRRRHGDRFDSDGCRSLQVQ